MSAFVMRDRLLAGALGFAGRSPEARTAGSKNCLFVEEGSDEHQSVLKSPAFFEQVPFDGGALAFVVTDHGLISAGLSTAALNRAKIAREFSRKGEFEPNVRLVYKLAQAKRRGDG